MHAPTRYLLPVLLLFLAFAATGCGQTTASVATKHFEPKRIKITLDDLPAPFASESAEEHPRVVPPPADAELRAPAGFSVNVFAELPNARWLAFTPEGELLCAASKDNTVYKLVDGDGDGVMDSKEVIVDAESGANQPFGMAFAEDSFFLANTDAVLRYPCYREGNSWKLGEPQQITELPGGGYNQHWTRNIVLSPDGAQLYVTVGSKENIGEEELPRASVFRMNLDGSERETFAYGLRNPVGLAFHPQTGEPYVTVNERDGLGDNLVPDYFTRIAKGEFYGWPYAYLSPANIDPRLAKEGKSLRPDLVAQTTVPDVLFQSHSAALGLTFSKGKQLPAKYRHGAFCAFRGSWNRAEGVGYKIVFVPFGEDHRPRGYYEDFVTGFLIDPAGPVTWARPVGVVMSASGVLYFTDDGNGRVYRVTYQGDAG